MTCQNCVRHVREAIQSVPNVEHVNVDLNAALAHVRFRSSEENGAQSIINAVEEAGFTAKLAADGGIDSPSPLSWIKDWKTSVASAATALLFFMVAEWVFAWHHESWFRWTAFGIAAFIQVYCGSRFYLGAWRQLKNGKSNMDTLVSLGSTAAFTYSVYVLFTSPSQALYFMESVGIIAFVSIGHYIESLVAKKASGALESLMALTPSTATRIKSGEKSEVSVVDLRRNDQIIIAPGEKVPVDGLVSSGESSCDESMLTGESIPVDKNPDQPVYAGTLNLSGSLIVVVRGTGAETALARIIEVVAKAQTSQANVQRLADKISSVFVPIVVLIAIATAILWTIFPELAESLHGSLAPYLWNVMIPATALAAGVIHCAGVLIIACPCAMGLATPIAIMAGTNVAARHGILIRDGQALEQTGRITEILFDKTGTLTEGKPSVANVEWFPPCDTENRKAEEIVASLSSKSTHPLSQAIARHFTEKHEASVPLSLWQEHPAKGIEATIEPPHAHGTHSVKLGSFRWLEQSGVDLAAAVEFQQEHTQAGATVIGVSIDQTLTAAIAVRDQIKPQARAMVQSLTEIDLRVSMVSGDNRQTAVAIARELGISEEAVHAEISPEGKAGLIEQRQRAGASVCFVGDGINDAPALEKANLGIAVRAASDIAKESADIVLLQSDIQSIPRSLQLSKATLRTIKQNLFWAFFYNSVGIPLAALGFLSPILCAAAMGFSDLVVVGNALRLRFRKF